MEWVLAPDGGARVTKLGCRLDSWLSGVCLGLGAGIEDLLLRHRGQSPGRVFGLASRGVSLLGTPWSFVGWLGTP